MTQTQTPTASTSPTVYLAALDESAFATHVLEVACGLGAAFGAPAELHILYVTEMVPVAAMAMIPPLVSSTELLEGGRAMLDRTTAYAAQRFHGPIVGHLATGEPWREIVQMASNLRADLVVVGTASQKGLARMVLGSVAEKVVRHAGCPVLVVRPKDHHLSAEVGIEPPCADCIAVQTQSHRAKLWCERHSAHHPRGRLHYELPETFALGSMNFRP